MIDLAFLALALTLANVLYNHKQLIYPSISRHGKFHKNNKNKLHLDHDRGQTFPLSFIASVLLI